MMHRVLLSVLATPDIGGIRTASLHDQEFTVVPCIALVEGVLWPSNAPGPELALAQEFGRFGGQEWNGRPLVLNHPQDADGNPISASDFSVLETHQFGHIYNARIEDKKLHVEMWINNSRVETLGGEFQDTVNRLTSGEHVVEVSTGLFMQLEESEGSFEGQKFGSIWRNPVPDHLALLSEGSIGACSVEGGCGAPRTNKMAPSMHASRLDFQGTPALITNSINSINSTDPGKECVDCSCGGECEECKSRIIASNEQDKTQKGLFNRILSAIKGRVVLDIRDAALSEQDIRTAIYAGLEQVEEEQVWAIIAIYHDTSNDGRVIYESMYSTNYYQRSFSVEEGGAITMGSERTVVRPETNFVPVVISGGDEITANETGGETDPPKQEINMDKKAFVQGLIDNEATKYTADDEEWLLTLEEGQLQKLEPNEAAPTSPVEDNPGDTGNPDGNDPQTVESFLSQAPEDIRAVLNSGLTMRTQRRKAHIKALTDSGRCNFTEAELSAFSDTALDNIVALANVPSYEGQGPIALSSNSDDEKYTEAPNVLNALGTQSQSQSQPQTH